MNTAFVLSNGRLYSCGVGGDGRLGLGENQKKVFVPTRVHFDSERGSMALAVALSASTKDEKGGHMLVLMQNGSVHGCGCCGNARIGVRQRHFSRLGYNKFSRTCYSFTGDFMSTDIFRPIKLPLSESVVCIAAGVDTSAFLTIAGHVGTFGMALRPHTRTRELWARGIPPATVLSTALEENTASACTLLESNQSRLDQLLEQPSALMPEELYWHAGSCLNLDDSDRAPLSCIGFGYGCNYKSDTKPVPVRGSPAGQDPATFLLCGMSTGALHILSIDK
jgi:hypothetical protein